MRLIVAIGNPGEKYAKTRLNAGTIVIDKIAAQLANIFPRQQSFDWRTTGKYVLLALKQDPVTIIVKPRTFLSQIGASVRKLAHFYLTDDEKQGELDLPNLYVVHFDLSLKMGDFRIENTPSTNDYVQKIAVGLGSDSFWKVRIGVGDRKGVEANAEDPLLTELTDVEFALLRDVGDKLIVELELRVEENT